MTQAEINDLVICNIPFVYHIIHKNYPTFAKDEDVIQAGMVGLVKAANNYDPGKGKFSTYAGVVIQNEIKREFRLRQNDSATVSLEQLIDGGWEW